MEDLGSRNGTYIEGVRLSPRARTPIEDGARIRIGKTILVYREQFFGADTPSSPIGGLVGPFGLREVAAALETLRSRPQFNVLLEGETGTGKELLARAVAAALGRTRPYLAMNVAGVPAGVFESQLFGYVPGAYSGSGKGSPGALLEHDRGAIFLDEIGELPLELQPKLLRFLENREIQAVGATKPSTADVLVIAATLQVLDDLVRAGRFRMDLVARFGARIELPPLRERTEDLFTVLQALAAKRNEEYDVGAVEVEAIERLMLHAWQRNVRELDQVRERIAAVAPPPALPLWAVERVLGPASAERALPLTRETVEQVLSECGGNESAAARKLNITRARLRRFRQKG